MIISWSDRDGMSLSASSDSRQQKAVLKEDSTGCQHNAYVAAPVVLADLVSQLAETDGVAAAGAGLRDIRALLVALSCSCGCHRCHNYGRRNVPRDECIWDVRRATLECSNACIAVSQLINSSTKTRDAQWGGSVAKGQDMLQGCIPENRLSEKV